MKSSIRSKIITLRGKIPIREAEIKSSSIARKLFRIEKIPFFNTRWSLYLPIKKEVDTKKIFVRLHEFGSVIYLPVFEKETQSWGFRQFTSWSDLETGPFEILQPKSGNVLKGIKLDVAVVPGVAFSKDGVRLGFGKGVFDKLLADSDALKIGLAYDFQIVDKIPYEKHDIKVNFIVSEKRILKVT